MSVRRRIYRREQSTRPHSDIHYDKKKITNNKGEKKRIVFFSTFETVPPALASRVRVSVFGARSPWPRCACVYVYVVEAEVILRKIRYRRYVPVDRVSEEAGKKRGGSLYGHREAGIASRREVESIGGSDRQVARPGEGARRGYFRAPTSERMEQQRRQQQNQQRQQRYQQRQRRGDSDRGLDGGVVKLAAARCQ